MRKQVSGLKHALSVLKTLLDEKKGEAMEVVVEEEGVRAEDVEAAAAEEEEEGEAPPLERVDTDTVRRAANEVADLLYN